MPNSLSPLELAELQADFDTLDAEFADLGFDEMGDAQDEMSELDAELSGTGLAEMAGGGGGDFSQMFAEDFDEQFIGNLIKNKAKAIIAKIVGLVKKAKGCAHCMPKVLNAVRLFKSGSYVSALKAAWDAYRCIRKCLS